MRTASSSTLSVDIAEYNMTRFIDLVADQSFIFTALSASVLLVVAWTIITYITNVYFHTLSKYPGPLAGAATEYYKSYQELIKADSWHLHLEELHSRYGPVVRVGPNELHFAEPQAYHDIYNNSNRWDKEPHLYHSFNEDESSFGFLTYKEAKQRKDILGKSFSLKAVTDARSLIQDKVDTLCKAFDRLASAGKRVNISHAYRCMTLDIITYYCFGKSVDAINAPDFRAPIIVAMDASLPVFVAFKHSSLLKNMILKSPRPISRFTSPKTSGLVDLQELLENQITELASRPEKLELLPHSMTIYHSLMNKDAYKDGVVPTARSLYDEAQALMFAGADTVGNTLMLATFHMLRDPSIISRLKTELQAIYPDPATPPSIQQLESLPFLNACIKEALRMSSGVVSGLPRIVPQGGARIADKDIPAGTIVSIGSTFVHYDPTIFPQPHLFRPDRWLEQPDLETWLVPFSRGPRSCLGINLAWLELRLAMASVFRRFDFQLTADAPTQLRFREAFLPMFVDGPIYVSVKRAVA